MKKWFISVLLGKLLLMTSMLCLAQQNPVRELENAALTRVEADAYLTAKPLGFTRVADLNGYPSPRQVLRWSTSLKLNIPQYNRTVMNYKRMRKYAIQYGREIVRKEQLLDSLFQRDVINVRQMERLVREIAELEGKLRAVHLKARIAQKHFLDDEQLLHYAELEKNQMGEMLAFDE